jgi:hypothetical protein
MDPDLRTREALTRRGLLVPGRRGTLTDLGREVARRLAAIDRLRRARTAFTRKARKEHGQ